MINHYVRIWHLAIVVCVFSANSLLADVEIHPTQLGGYMDLGQIVSGKFVKETPSDTVDADNQFLTRTLGYLTQSATVNDRLDISFTLAGLYFYALPEETNKGLFRFVQPGIGVGQAQAVYKFGDPEQPWSKLQMGLFPIKYNPDAKNLGEFLFRSGTYPGIIYGGGWTYIGGAEYMAQGLRYSITHLDGALTHDFSLTIERGYEPNNNLSPAYLVTYKAGAVFELGAGLMWAHAISMQDSLLSPEDPQNAYIKPGTAHADAGLPLAYREDTFLEQVNKPHYDSNDPRVLPDSIDNGIGGKIENPCLTSDPSDDPDPNNPCYDQSFVSVTGNGIPGEDLAYYNFRGFKGMVRAKLDIGVIMGMEPDNFKMYGEIALLGFKDYPFYYEKKSERMPMMFGLNIPTFGLLDAFSLELGYLKSRFPNNVHTLYTKKWPLPLPDDNVPISGHTSNPWTFNLEDPAYTDPNHPDYVEGAKEKIADAFTKDDWKWSVYARKQITEGFAVSTQVASDYQRQVLFQSYAPKFMNFPATRYSSDWYFVLRLEMGL